MYDILIEIGCGTQAEDSKSVLALYTISLLTFFFDCESSMEDEIFYLFIFFTYLLIFSGFSRLKLLTSDNEKNEGLIVFLVFLVLILFIGISAWTYNIYLQRIKAKHINDNSTSIRYRAFENEANENTNTEAALTQ